jgi:hypothetical protein
MSEERYEIVLINSLLNAYGKKLNIDCVRIIMSYLINTCNGYGVKYNIYCQIWVNTNNTYCTTLCCEHCLDYDNNYTNLTLDSELMYDRPFDICSYEFEQEEGYNQSEKLGKINSYISKYRWSDIAFHIFCLQIYFIIIFIL